MNIDSDLYESSVEVLRYFGSRFVPGTVLLLDEYRGIFNNSDDHGERRAFREYIAETGAQFTHLMDYGNWGSAFVTVSPGAKS